MDTSMQTPGLIRRIEALNYRGLRYVSQGVGPFEVLVGPNGSGKSTFLDVVALIGDFVRNGLDNALLFGQEIGNGRARSLDELIFNQGADQFELALEMALPGGPSNYAAPDGIVYHYDTARYVLVVGRADSGEIEVKEEVLRLIDNGPRRETPPLHDGAFPVESTAPRTLLEATVLASLGDAMTTADESLIPSRIIFVRDNADRGRAIYLAELTDHRDRDLALRVGPRASALFALPDDPERFPIAIWARSLLRDGIHALALNSAAMRNPVSSSASRDFDVAGANLPLVIEDLEKKDRTAYLDWLAHVQTILPDIKGIQVLERPEDRSRYLAISYAGSTAPVPSWLVSDVTLRLLALTLLPYLPGDPSIYLIEEPENGLHPRAIEGIFQSLSSVYRGQVFVATHSPLFMGLAEPDQLLCFAKAPSGAVDIVRGDRHPALANWHGQVDLSTLYASGVLG